ncbi:MAG: DUF167 domain-containing protein [Bacteriovorax sp.]|nr:DUF167 domain-containing protein [Bacteriovorax sp.]
MIEDLIEILKSKKLLIEILEKSPIAFIISFNVWAKPGSKVEKIFISNDGILIIQTRSKPIDGEANQAIIEAIAGLMGISKSEVEIVRGDKSRLKKIKLKLVLTANKKESFYEKKISAILTQEALN